MKRSVVTGASRGIGRAIAVKLAGEGFHSFLQGRDPEALNESGRLVETNGGKATAITAELSNTKDIQALVETVGGEPLDLLVNNAGMARVKPVQEMTLEEWNLTFAVNVTAPFLLTQKLLPLMQAGASVVNILSVASRTGFPDWSAYCMSKFALEGFSQSLREELRERGIRVINIYPTATDTDIWSHVEGDWPREKMMDPAEVAEAVCYAVRRPPNVVVETINLGGIAGTL
ncbi:MAG: SDR family oxidoreductase [bacterium]|nr:SDR family oxidoreductase [bacterium]